MIRTTLVGDLGHIAFGIIIMNANAKNPELKPFQEHHVRPGSDWPGGLPGDSRWAGGPVGRWAGMLVGRWPVKILWYIIFAGHWYYQYYYNKLQDCLSRVVMAKRRRRNTVTIKLWCFILFHVTFGHYNSWWAILFFILIFAVFLTNDGSNIISIQMNYFVSWSSVYPWKIFIRN